MKAYSPAGGSFTLTEQKARVMVADMIANDEIDLIGDEPVCQPDSPIECIISAINSSGRITIFAD